MDVPAERLLSSMLSACATDIHGSVDHLTAGALRVLLAREQGGAGEARARLGQLADICKALAALGSESGCAPPLIAEFASIGQQSAEASSGSDLAALERRLQSLRRSLEAAVGALFSDKNFVAPYRSRAIARLGQWEESALRPLDAVHSGDNAKDHSITAEKLQHYLQHRFGDRTLQVVTCEQLGGGFGKQTFAFEARGRELSGSFILRRDVDDPTLPGDCHEVRLEFPVLQAIASRGIPGPEVLWLDVDHALLPGGDFIVMKRSPGVTGGDVLGASAAPSKEMLKTLATTLAQIHRMTPPRELGGITDSIDASLFDLPAGEVTRRYIEGYYNFYEQDAKGSSPAIAALFKWLLDHIPYSVRSPVLVHGDVGFHNMIVHEGQLSAIVDWEFVHLGDPVEDLGYLKSASGGQMDWDAFADMYRAAGGPDFSEEDIRFFEVWGQVRNAMEDRMTEVSWP